MKVLPLQDKVGEQYGEGEARPHDGFGDSNTEVIPARDTANHPDFEKDYCHSEASGHPLTVLLNLSVENEYQGDASGEQPGRIHRSSVSGGGSGATSALKEVCTAKPS